MPIKCALTFLTFVMFCVACTHAFDRTKVPVTRNVGLGKMVFYPDSNVLFYKSNYGLMSDNEVWQPKSFHMQFPKGLHHCDLLGDQYYIFYYAHNQVILIKTLIGPPPPDSSYVPNKVEIDSLIHGRLHIVEKYNIGIIPILSGRQQWIITRKGAIVLFYNIRQKNFNAFLASLNSFQYTYVEPYNKMKIR